MNRRRMILSILLSCLMISSTFTSVFAASNDNEISGGETKKKTSAVLKSTLGVGDIFEDTFEQGDKTFTITYKVTSTSPNEVSFALKNTPKENITELSGMYEIPSSVEYNGIQYTVTSLEDSAFYVFDPTGNRGTQCTYIIIPDTITSIGEYAFYQNSKLKSIYIPDSVTSIGAGAFSSCHNVKKLRFSRNLSEMSDSAFYLCDIPDIVVPSNIKTLGEGVFRTENLKRVRVLEGVESIGKQSFTNFMNTIEEVELPESVTSVDREFIYGHLNSSGAKLIIHSPSLDIDFRTPLASVTSGTVYGHKGSTAAKSKVYENFEKNKSSYGGVSFSTDGVCHGNTVISRTEPTCGTDGSVTYASGDCDCGNTGVPETTIVLPATGFHDCSWKTTKEPTCTAKGTKAFICDTCKDVFIEPIEISETGVHDYSVEVTEKAANCTEKGLKYMKCKYCGLKDNTSEKEIPSLGHKFNKEVIDEKATYEKEGKKHLECSVCGVKDVNSYVLIPKLSKTETGKNSVSDGSTVTKTNSKTKTDSPDTSDSSNSILYGLIAIFAVAGVGGTIFKIKKIS